MSKDDLTAVQCFVLLTLMIKAAPVPNPTFSNSLKTDARKDLEKRGFIEIVGQRPMSLELTQKGHDRAVAELGREQPPRSGSAGLALYTTLDFLGRLLDRTGLDARDLFRLRGVDALLTAAPAAPAEPGATPDDLDARIRGAYAALVAKAGEFVMLDELREALPGVARPAVDAALVSMNLSADVHLIPESNQKVLTPRQREAAVSIGNQDRHLLGIDA